MSENPPDSMVPDAAVATRPGVHARSHLTLHYRLTIPDGEVVIFSTFEGKPATLQLGIGQLAEGLERCLLGLNDGDIRTFELTGAEAFGARHPELVRTLPRSMLPRPASGQEAFAPGDVVRFPAPDGSEFAGVLKSFTDQNVVFDFNHPLAGQAMRFHVQIIGVL